MHSARPLATRARTPRGRAVRARLVFDASYGRILILVFCLSSRVVVGALRLVVGVVVAVGCTVNEPGRSKLTCNAEDPACLDAAVDTQTEVQVGPSDARVEPQPPTTEAGLAALCPDTCNPEDVQSCTAPPLSALVSWDGGEGVSASDVAFGANALELSLDAAAALAGDASLGETLLPGAPGDGGSPPTMTDFETGLRPDAALDGGGLASDGGAGQLGVLDAATVGGPGNPTSVPACQLVLREGYVAAECAQAGSGTEGAACAASRDCAPGLGCVGSAGAGQCLPYCCGGNDSCGTGRYCTQRPLRSPDIADGQSAPTIPVCAVADNCPLMLDSCSDKGVCSCPEGLACTIVRADTTACVDPGGGQEGESCPCAPGYFCSQGTNTCLKFCDTKDPASSCGTRQCQPGPRGFPLGWGLCVGDP